MITSNAILDLQKTRKLGPELVCMRGFPRSGSNWLAALLNQHPKINCLGEFHLQNLFDGFLPYLEFENSIYKTCPENRTILVEGLNNIVRSILRMQADYKPGSKIVVSKTPGPINSDYLPACKYLFLVRDGRDVLVSWTYHMLSIFSEGRMRGNAYLLVKKFEKFKNDPNYFLEHPLEMLDDEVWVKHIGCNWATLCKSYLGFVEVGLMNVKRAHLIKYEDLLGDVYHTRNKIFQFLNIDPEEAQEVESDPKGKTWILGKQT